MFIINKQFLMQNLSNLAYDKIFSSEIYIILLYH